MTDIDKYCGQLDRELRRLPRDRRREIIARLKADLRIQMEEQGKDEAQFCAGLPNPGDMAAEFLDPAKINSAGMVARLFALFLDLALVFLPLVLLVPMARLFSGQGLILGLGGGLLLLSQLGMLALYFPVSEGTWGQTAGKALLGIMVVREDGRPISYGQAFIRRLSLWFNLFLIDGIFAFFMARGQRALDRVAGTMVVRSGHPKPWPMVITVVMILAVFSGSALSLVGISFPQWLTPDVPDVPGSGLDLEAVVHGLDLTEYGFTLAELDRAGQVVDSRWQSAEGDLNILAYRGDEGNGFLRDWSRADRIKTASFSHQWGDVALRRYRTQDQHKYGWCQGEWAFAIEASRDQFSPEEFKALVNSISWQLKNMR